MEIFANIFIYIGNFCSITHNYISIQFIGIALNHRYSLKGLSRQYIDDTPLTLASQKARENSFNQQGRNLEMDSTSVETHSDYWIHKYDLSKRVVEMLLRMQCYPLCSYQRLIYLWSDFPAGWNPLV